MDYLPIAMNPYRYVPVDETLYTRLHSSDSTQLVPPQEWPPFVSEMAAQPLEEIIRLDREYIKRWSLLLDLSILLKTVPSVLRSSRDQ